jgi:hypothetical protein
LIAPFDGRIVKIYASSESIRSAAHQLVLEKMAAKLT